MFATVTALVLTFSPSLALDTGLPPPPVVEAPSLSNTRSASLLAQETVTLERRVRSSRLLPVWVPLVAGVGGGALAAGLGFLALTTLSGYSLATFGQVFIGVMLLVAGPIFALAGVITAIVFAVKNVDREERRAAAQRDLDRARDELSRAREVERTQSLLTPWREGLETVPPSLTVAEF